MATIKRLVPKVKLENRALFASHTGDVHLLQFESEDGDTKFQIIISDDAITASHFYGDMEIGDILINKATPMVYIKTAATTLSEVGDIT